MIVIILFLWNKNTKEWKQHQEYCLDDIEIFLLQLAV